MPKIVIRGLPELKKKLQRIELEKWKVVIGVVDKYVDLMVAEARRLAPVDRGFTKNSITKERRGDFNIAFIVGTAYAAMNEFGTGDYMDIPPELEQDALVFKGYKHGDFNEFLQEIKEWCGRKGIDENAAYPIAITILNRGIKPQPFFWPAYNKYKDQMIDEANRELQKLVNI